MFRPMLCTAALLLSASAAMALEPLDTMQKAVLKLHAAATGIQCQAFDEGFQPENNYFAYEFEFTEDYEGAEPQTFQLFQVYCFSGAYNVSHAYYWNREYEGLQPLYFAEPWVDPIYENPDETMDSKVLELNVVGLRATNILINSEYLEDSSTIVSYSLWRGLGDASSTGTWRFENGQYLLKKFEVDASYDGESNLEVVVDYETEPTN